MLIPLEHLRQFYDRILQNALDPKLKGAATVQIFATNETDSLCALKILTGLFKTDELQYILTPVFSNEDLRDNVNKLQSNQNVLFFSIYFDQIRSIIFINCGGLLNQTTFWYYNSPMTIEAFIFDSHRPFNHMNLCDPQGRIFIIQDGCNSFNQYPTPADFQDFQNYLSSGGYDDYDSEEDEGAERDEEDNSEEADEDDDDDEERREAQEELEDLQDNGSDQDEEVYGERVKRPTIASQDDEEAEVVDGGAQDDLDSVMVGVKRNSDQQEGTLKVKEMRKLKRQRRKLVENYYNGIFYFKPASFQMYQVCLALNKENNDFLWLWIVGMFDQIIHQKQNKERLEEDLMFAMNEVVRHNPSIYNQQQDSYRNGYQDDAYEDSKAEEAKNDRIKIDLFDVVETQSKNFEIGSIFMQQELKLMLLKHWSLYESINNSEYTVSQLKLWKEPGRRELQKFLATVGISLEEAKQEYKFMNPNLRNELKTRMIKAASQFGIEHILHNSFQMQIDAKLQIQATDMAYSLSAILEAPRNQNPKMAGVSYSQMSSGSDNLKLGDVNNMLQTRVVPGHTLNQNMLIQKDMEIKQRLDYLKQSRYDNFYVALDALERKNSHLLVKGIELAKELQKAIIDFGTSIIEKKQIRSMDRYRYCFLDYDAVKDIELFHFPQALSKLALFLQVMYHRIHKNAKTRPKPFVLSVKNNKKGSTLLVTVLGNSLDDNNGKKKITREKHIRASNDSFDTSIIEINNEDVQPFFDEFTNQYGKLQGSETF